MYKIAALLSSAVLLAPTPVLAELVLVGRSDDGIVKSFVDTDSINRSGKNVSFLEVHKLSIPNNWGASITISRNTVDCDSGKISTYHVAGMTQSGKVLYDKEYNDPEPKALLPGSVGGAVYEFVCYEY